MQSSGLPVLVGNLREKIPRGQSHIVQRCTDLLCKSYFLRFSLGNAHSCPRPRTGLTSPSSPSFALHLQGLALLTIEPRTQDHLWKSLPKGWSSHSPGCTHWQLKEALICTSKRPVTKQPCSQFTKWKTLVFGCRVQLFITRLLSMNRKTGSSWAARKNHQPYCWSVYTWLKNHWAYFGGLFM